MRRFLLIFVPLILARPASAQYTPPSLDTYGGYNAVSCTNTNTAFSIVMLSNHKVLCDPAGHAFFMRAPFTFDNGIITTADESGNGYNNYATTKYTTTATWVTQSTTVFQSWGWNSLAAYANANAFPYNSGKPVPFIAFSNIANYSLTNHNSYGTCAPKDLFYSMGFAGNASTWGGFINANGLVDFRDPCYASFHAAFLANDVNFAIGTQTVANKHYLIGISDADSDNTHGLNAGPDFTAAQGNNDFRLGYTAFFVSPLSFADSHQSQIYTDGTVYMKKRFHDLVIAAHTNIAGVNTSWGSSYGAVDLTSGNCFGSLMPAWICPSPGAAFALGTGNGATTTFSGTITNTVVSKFSLYVAISGVIIGGDTGTGNIYGKGCGGLTGTINYATGAIAITCTTAPANTAPITAGYVQNGWGIGTGFMDEDCRAGHSGYCGSGSASVTINLTGIPANVQTDINAQTKDIAAYYSSTGKANVATWASTNSFVGPVLYFGPTPVGSWGVPPDRYVLQGYSGNLDAMQEGGGGSGFTHWTQTMIDFVHTHMGDEPLFETSYRPANAQSAFAWPNSTCNHSGAAVTCTVATPNKFSALVGNSHIQTSCNFSDYQVSLVNFTATATTVTYTASGTPTEASATCNVSFDDSGLNGFATQNARCTDFQTDQVAAVNLAYTTGGVKPVMGYVWWGWQDNWAEQLNWGIVDVRDNPYNGVDNITATGACSINAGFNCGGDLALHGTLGNCVSLIQATSTSQDTAILALANTIVPAPAPLMFAFTLESLTPYRVAPRPSMLSTVPEKRALGRPARQRAHTQHSAIQSRPDEAIPSPANACGTYSLHPGRGGPANGISVVHCLNEHVVIVPKAL